LPNLNLPPNQLPPHWVEDNIRNAELHPDQTSITQKVRGTLVDMAIIVGGVIVLGLVIWGAVLLFKH
jgi:hypothetical protein